MPASLLSLVILTSGAALVGKGVMKMWLEGPHPWYEINEAPWHDGHMLKRVIAGASKFAPDDSIQPKHELVTIEHLRSLCCNIDLSNSFNIAVFTLICIVFWCCCRYSLPAYEPIY